MNTSGGNWFVGPVALSLTLLFRLADSKSNTGNHLHKVHRNAQDPCIPLEEGYKAAFKVQYGVDFNCECQETDSGLETSCQSVTDSCCNGQCWDVTTTARNNEQEFCLDLAGDIEVLACSTMAYDGSIELDSVPASCSVTLNGVACAGGCQICGPDSVAAQSRNGLPWYPAGDCAAQGGITTSCDEPLKDIDLGPSACSLAANGPPDNGPPENGPPDNGPPDNGPPDVLPNNDQDPCLAMQEGFKHAFKLQYGVDFSCQCESTDAGLETKCYSMAESCCNGQCWDVTTTAKNEEHVYCLNSTSNFDLLSCSKLIYAEPVGLESKPEACDVTLNGVECAGGCQICGPDSVAAQSRSLPWYPAGDCASEGGITTSCDEPLKDIDLGPSACASAHATPDGPPHDGGAGSPCDAMSEGVGAYFNGVYDVDFDCNCVEGETPGHFETTCRSTTETCCNGLCAHIEFAQTTGKPGADDEQLTCFNGTLHDSDTEIVSCMTILFGEGGIQSVPTSCSVTVGGEPCHGCDICGPDTVASKSRTPAFPWYPAGDCAGVGQGITATCDKPLTDIELGPAACQIPAASDNGDAGGDQENDGASATAPTSGSTADDLLHGGPAAANIVLTSISWLFI